MQDLEFYICTTMFYKSCNVPDNEMFPDMHIPWQAQQNIEMYITFNIFSYHTIRRKNDKFGSKSIKNWAGLK